MLPKKNLPVAIGLAALSSSIPIGCFLFNDTISQPAKTSDHSHIPDPGIREIRRCVDNPVTAKEHYTVAVYYRGRGRYTESRQSCQRAIKLDQTGEVALASNEFIRTKLPKTDLPADAEYNNSIGHNYLVEGKLGQAEKIFVEIVHDYPKFDFAYVNLALVKKKQGKLDECRDLLEKALEINPHNSNAAGWLEKVCAQTEK